MLFQFLIGRLQTKLTALGSGSAVQFQFLIGRLQTDERRKSMGRELEVSIPHR